MERVERGCVNPVVRRRRVTSVLHQAWSDGSFFPVVNRSARALVESGAKVVWTVEAESWVEAMARYHEWRGWSPYRPMDDDPGTYTAEQEAEAARWVADAEPGDAADGGGG